MNKLISSVFFSGALSKANSAIAGAKFKASQECKDAPDVYALSVAAAHAAFQELVNIEPQNLAVAAAKADLLNKPALDGFTNHENLIMLSCDIVVTEAMGLHKEEVMPIEIVKDVWVNTEFVAKRRQVVRVNDGVVKAKSIDELNAETEAAIASGASNECEGGACKL